MKTISLSSTELKRNTAEILNSVAFGEAIAIVERYGEPLVKIVPAKPSRVEDLEVKIKKYFGVIPDFPSVGKARYFRKRRFNI